MNKNLVHLVYFFRRHKTQKLTLYEKTVDSNCFNRGLLFGLGANHSAGHSGVAPTKAGGGTGG